MTPEPSDLVSIMSVRQENGKYTAVVTGSNGGTIALAKDCTMEQYAALENAIFNLIP